ncbi:MAG: hypothetical protein JWP48_1304 [Actinoallomurus sp.]|jgi:hypothetical protein|nr:hypothetical protein [Actinoallomurus sp.]
MTSKFVISRNASHSLWGVAGSDTVHRGQLADADATGKAPRCHAGVYANWSSTAARWWWHRRAGSAADGDGAWGAQGDESTTGLRTEQDLIATFGDIAAGLLGNAQASSRAFNELVADVLRGRSRRGRQSRRSGGP